MSSWGKGGRTSATSNLLGSSGSSSSSNGSSSWNTSSNQTPSWAAATQSFGIGMNAGPALSRSVSVSQSSAVASMVSSVLPERVKYTIAWIYSQRGARLVTLLLGLLFLVWLIAELASGSDPLTADTVVEPGNLRYGIVIDAGSSGSRVYLYSWPQELNEQGLVTLSQLYDENGKPLVRKQEPGLSTFANNPTEAFESIFPLLKFASQYIPVEEHERTPLFIYATAGMRLLQPHQSDAIILDIVASIPKHFSFNFQPSNMQIISGAMEGVYSWVAVNYALGRFSRSHSRGSGPTTAGSVEMGGASIQITFEVDSKESVPEEYLQVVQMGEGREYRLYATTFLRYGANEARTRYLEKLVHGEARDLARDGIIEDPCLTAGETVSMTLDSLLSKSLLSPVMMEELGLGLPSSNDVSTLQDGVTLIGTGQFQVCKELLVPLLNLTVPCVYDRCSFNGVYQPAVSSVADWFGFSEYYYTSHDVFKVSGPYDQDVFHDLALQWCGSNTTDLHVAAAAAKVNHDRISTQCFKSAWMTTVLHMGHGLSTATNNLVNTERINNIDVGWTLGVIVLSAQQSASSEAISADPASSAMETFVVGLVLCIIIIGYVMARRRQRADVWDVGRV